MKPDKPGEWYSRDGRRIVVWSFYGESRWRFVDDSEYMQSRPISVLEGDYWLPAEPPTFPELPPKPPMVLATVCGESSLRGPEWWIVIREFASTFYRGVSFSVKSLKVVPHPDNDPEAVRLIEEAQTA